MNSPNRPDDASNRNYRPFIVPFFALFFLALFSWLLRRPATPSTEKEKAGGHELEITKTEALPTMKTQDLGTARVMEPDARQKARQGKVATAIRAWQDHEKKHDLPPQPRRNLAQAATKQPPHQEAALLMKPAQQRALATLRWQAEKSVTLRTFAEDGAVRTLSGRILEPAATEAEPGYSLPATTVRSFLRKHGAVLGLSSATHELIPAREEKDPLGMTQVRMEQHYEGLPVWPAEAIIQTDKRGHVTAVTSTAVPTPEVSTKPTLSAPEAQGALRRYWHDEKQAPIITSMEAPELILYAKGRGQQPHLAYRAKISGNVIQCDTVIVDAHTGAGLACLSLVATEAVMGSGKDLYGQTRPIPLWQDNGTYWLVDTTRPMFDPAGSQLPAKVKGGIQINQYSGDANGDKYTLSLLASTSSTAGFSADAVSAANTVSKIYDHFRTHLGRNSYDGQGHTIQVGVGLDAFNAYFNHGTGTMIFGTQDFFARSEDVTAHELFHGITGTTAGLIYQNQSGALNEAMSDIFAESMESVFKGGADPDWIIGTATQFPIRDFINPGTPPSSKGGPQPKKMSEFVNTQQDNGGVHVNSGIINHAYYQLAKGLASGAIGIPKAEAIYYRALATKLQQSSNFVDCRLTCIKSAEEIHGAGSAEAQAVGKAFDVVEIFDQQAPPPPQPLPETSGADSAVVAFDYIDGFRYLGRRESALGDPTLGTFLSLVTIAPGTRPAVTGDGTLAVCVSSDYDGVFLNTMTGASQFFDLSGEVASVAVSADATVYGLVFQDPFSGVRDNRIDVYDSKTSRWTSYELKNPTLDGGLTDTVLFADAIDFTADGAIMVYDALNLIKNASGQELSRTYSFYLMDLKTRAVASLFTPNPDLNLGNPSFGQRHNNFLTFEIDNTNEGMSTIVAVDMASKSGTTLGKVPDVVSVAFPSWFGNDEAVLFANSSERVLYRQAVNNTLAATGAAQPWISGMIGAVYRRGTYRAMPRLSVAVADGTASETGADPASIRITRTGGGGEAVPFSFSLTGSAGNGSDFSRLPLSFTLPDGLTSASIAIVPMDDSVVEGTESVTLNLLDGLNYRAESANVGAISIMDNDTGGSAYQRFIATTSLTGANAAATADPDRDSVPNMIEGYFATDPTKASILPVQTLRNGNDFVMRWTRPIDLRGFVATPQWSPELQNWLVTGETGAGIPARTITITDLGPQAGVPGHLMEAKVPMTGYPRAALRLHIAAP